MRDFKKVEIDGEFYLYPVPVIKNNKYLILCGTLSEAEEMQTAISEKRILHPDEQSHHFTTVRYHTDEKTPILKFSSVK
jgi:hypothetical protein